MLITGQQMWVSKKQVSPEEWARIEPRWEATIKVIKENISKRIPKQEEWCAKQRAEANSKKQQEGVWEVPPPPPPRWQEEQEEERKKQEEEERKKREHKKWTTRDWLPGGVTGLTMLKFCKHFYSKNGCQRGDYCTFAHADDEIGQQWRPRGIPGHDSVRKMAICKFHAQGSRKQG